MSANLFAAGIFAHETGQRLLHILLRLTHRGFRGLYDKCQNDLRGAYYQAGLRRVPLWSDAVLLEDIEHVTHECSDFTDTFETCFRQYISDRFRSSRSSYTCPTILTFTRRFFECIGHHDAMTSGDYFHKGDPVTTHLACMDAARQALYAIVTSESVRIELASEVGVEARSTPLPQNRRSDEVGPEDSISQVGSHYGQVQPTPLARSPSRPVAPRARPSLVHHTPPHEEEEFDLDEEPSAPEEVEYDEPAFGKTQAATPPRSEARSQARSQARSEARSQALPEARSQALPEARSQALPEARSQAPSRARSEAHSEPPPRRSVAQNRGFRALPPLQITDSSSVVSRHEFEPSGEDMEDMVVIPPPQAVAAIAPAATAPATARAVPGMMRQTASSRDSSVSVGLRTIKSPRGQ